jgi:hypothetical protein
VCVRGKQFSLHFDPVGDVLAAARSCEAAVFLEAYGNTAQQWRDEYGPYDAASVFITILNPADDAVASCRLILPNRTGLKSLVDMQQDPWLVDANNSAAAAGMSPAATWDVATVAVRRGAAGAGVLSAALYHGIVAATRANHLSWVVMIMDARARRLLSMLDLETHVLPGTMAAPYLGSAASIPIFANVNHMMDGQRRLNPDGNQMIEHGVGLDAISIPDETGFVVNARALAVPVDFVPRPASADRARRLATFWPPLTA